MRPNRLRRRRTYRNEGVRPDQSASAYDASAGSLWGELYGADQMAAHAHALAARHRSIAAPAPWERPGWTEFLVPRRLPLFRRLADAERAIGMVRNHLLLSVRKGAEISPAGAWLLDNYFVVIEHARVIRAVMSRGFYYRLPKLVAGAHAGLPRIYDVALELVGHSDGRLDAENITRMIAKYQEVTPL